MARAAVLGRLTWQPATVADFRTETAVRTLVLDIDGWTGQLPGQHVVVRSTAPEGYTAYRSYSISSTQRPDRLEVSVQAVTDGEVSPYLVDVADAGNHSRSVGPLGLVRPPTDDTCPALPIGGGSGMAPLMSMVRAATNPTRLLYSTRFPADALFTAEPATAQPRAMGASLSQTSKPGSRPWPAGPT